MCFESTDPESFRDDQCSPDSNRQDANALQFKLATKIVREGLIANFGAPHTNFINRNQMQEMANARSITILLFVLLWAMNDGYSQNQPGGITY